jgi:hypothetical protein
MDLTHRVLAWFEDDELAVCPLCAERSVLPAWDDRTVCVNCGVIADPRTMKPPDQLGSRPKTTVFGSVNVSSA